MSIDTEVQTQQKERTKRGPKEPGRFAVVFHNDDMTPMDFVMQILETIFHHSRDKATELTSKDTQRRASRCGRVFSRSS